MMVCRVLVGFTDLQQPGIGAARGAELNAQGERWFAGGEAARDDERRNAGDVGEVDDIGTRRGWREGRNVGRDDFVGEERGCVAGGEKNGIAGLEDGVGFGGEDGFQAQGLDVVDGGVAGVGFEAFADEGIQ